MTLNMWWARAVIRFSKANKVGASIYTRHTRMQFIYVSISPLLPLPLASWPQLLVFVQLEDLLLLRFLLDKQWETETKGFKVVSVVKEIYVAASDIDEIFKKKDFEIFSGYWFQIKQTNSAEKLFIINLLPDAVSNFSNRCWFRFPLPRPKHVTWIRNKNVKTSGKIFRQLPRLVCLFWLDRWWGWESNTNFQPRMSDLLWIIEAIRLNV